MQKHLFPLSLCPLPKSRELRLRASDLPSLKVLLQRDGTQLSLELLAGPGSSEQTTTNLFWQRQAVRAGCGGAKVPTESLRIQGVAMGRHQPQFIPQDRPALPCSVPLSRCRPLCPSGVLF